MRKTAEKVTVGAWTLRVMDDGSARLEHDGRATLESYFPGTKDGSSGARLQVNPTP